MTELHIVNRVVVLEICIKMKANNNKKLYIECIKVFVLLVQKTKLQSESK